MLNKTLGKINGVLTKEYRAWVAMKSRCYSPSTSHLKYQKNGIEVCDRWKNSYDNFYEDMGPIPGTGYSLDRIDNSGDYSPENCRWATRTAQNSNRGEFNHLIEYQGESKLLREWCEILHLDYQTLRVRMWRYKGDNLSEILTKPFRKSRKLTELQSYVNT